MTNAVASNLLRARVRRGFADAHATLHALPTVQRLAAGTASRDDLAVLIGALHACHEVYETALRRHDLAAPFLLRSAALAQDAGLLGASSRRSESRPTPPRSRSALAGWMYVLEGSRVGATALRDRLPERLRDALRRYVETSVRERPAADRLLACELERAAAAEPSLATAIAAARQLGSWLCAALAADRCPGEPQR